MTDSCSEKLSSFVLESAADVHLAPTKAAVDLRITAIRILFLNEGIDYTVAMYCLEFSVLESWAGCQQKCSSLRFKI